LNWREINRTLSTYTEPQVLALLDAERVGQRRVAVLERLHQRYSSLRVTRERIELLKEAKKV
jgi:hypothetical protein